MNKQKVSETIKVSQQKNVNLLEQENRKLIK